MHKLLSDRRVVAVLAVLAGVFCYMRVVVPMLPEEFSDEAAPIAEYEFEDAQPGNDSPAAQPRVKLAASQFELRNIDVAAISFNQQPVRDPFVSKPTSATVLAEVSVDKPVKTTNRPVSVKSEVLPTLHAVIHSDERSAAVIGGAIVGVGDRVGHFDVREILRDQVILATVNSNRTVVLGITP